MPPKGQIAIPRAGTAIEARSVTKKFVQWQRENPGKLWRNLIKPQKKEIIAVDDASFSVARGEFVAYAGPNGAGKSTTMRILSGMLQPSSGTVEVLGLSPRRERIPLMKKVGVLFGNRTELWWDHPISQSFEWKRVVWDIDGAVYRRNVELVTELLDLGPLMKTFARELSLGQRMRCDLGLMLLHSPELILLDEPTLGLDVVAKRQMIDFLKRLNAEQGTTILVTSHDMDDLEEMAQRVMMIATGKVVYDGAFDGLRALTGSLSTVRIEVEGGDVPPFSCGVLLKHQHAVTEWAVDLQATPVQQVLAQVAQLQGVRDVEIRKAPIERVIASLYEKWQGRVDA